MKNKYYAGIGSRETPQYILDVMIYIGEKMAKLDYILRSGGAPGADEAFELGCKRGIGKMEIFLPWKGFNSNISANYNVPKKAVLIAKEIHPAWDKCSKWAQLLHGRNAQQILGKDLKTPCDLVVCWTESGKTTGGTATAIRIAEKQGIMVYNLGNTKYIELFSNDFFPINIERKYEYTF